MAQQPLTIDWTGMRCPRCSYVRRAADAHVDANCPRCHTPYADAADAPLRIEPAEHYRQMAEEAKRDPSLYILIATNLMVLGIAIYLGMSVRSLMLIYWVQSVVIGACSVVRIMKVPRFSIKGLSISYGEPLDESAETKRRTATFFVAHYGFFHAMYLAFLLLWPAKNWSPLGEPMAYVLCGVAFLVNHLFSLRRNLAKDAAGRPNIGTLMFLPYLRVLPMHIAICTGLAIAPGFGGVIFFTLLKTAADALMHIVEHHVLRAPATE